MSATSSRPSGGAYGLPSAFDLGRRVFPAIGLVLALGICGLALAACSTTRPTVPATLLTCAPQPPSPAGGTQRDAALYIVDLAAAGEDCRSKLGSVRRVLNSEY